MSNGIKNKSASWDSIEPEEVVSTPRLTEIIIRIATIAEIINSYPISFNLFLQLTRN